MDVGLGEAIGVSAAELKELIDSVKALKKEKFVLQDQHDELKYKFHDVEESMQTVLSKFEAAENDEVDEADEEEPGIALEDQLRITEQSAKAIDLLSNHLLSTVWQTCSKNTFGNSGSRF